jgi:hypothetical protein
MINMSPIFLDPDFAQSFEVFRSVGEFGEGGWFEIVQSPASFTCYGTILPASEKELKQLPEGDRVLGGIVIYGAEELYVTHSGEYEGTSDQIEWRGEKYKVVSSMPFVNFGFYVSIAQRLKGK